MSRERSRRQFISAAIVISAAFGAGCSSDSGGSGGTNTTDAETATATDATQAASGDDTQPANSPTASTPDTSSTQSTPAQTTGESTGPARWPMAFRNAGHTNSASGVSGPKNGFNEQWLEGAISEQQHPAVLANGKIYYGTISGLFARNLSDGTEAWSRDIQGSGSPVITETSAIFPAGDTLVSLDSSNGDRNWIYEPESGNVESDIILTLAGGLTFVPATTNTEILLHAVDTETGEVQWTYKKERSAAMAGIGSEVSDGENLYFYSDGTFRALGINDGNEKWTADVSYAAPVLEGDQIYLSGTDAESNESIVQAITTADGSSVWTHTTGAPRQPNIVPATDGDAIYTPTSNGIGALNPTDGSKLWSYKLVERLAASPTVADGVVYATEPNGRIHALAAESGEQMATGEFGDMDGPQTAAIGSNNILYVPSQGGIYALSE